MEIEEDDYLPLSQVFEDVENNQVIEIYILTPTAAEISVNNQMVDCKLLVGKGPKMKILPLETGSKDVTLEPIGWVSNKNGILLPKLFWPTVIKNCSSYGEFFFLKFEAEGREFAKN